MINYKKLQHSLYSQHYRARQEFEGSMIPPARTVMNEINECLCLPMSTYGVLPHYIQRAISERIGNELAT